MATWSNTNKSSSPSWANQNINVTPNGIAAGTPIGLLLSLTYATGVGWVSNSKSSAPSWNLINQS